MYALRLVSLLGSGSTPREGYVCGSVEGSAPGGLGVGVSKGDGWWI